jgi:hypothetical protein
MTALIYAALGLLGLNTGLIILIFCNFGMVKALDNLPKGQAAWFLWVGGVAELIAAYFFFAGAGDTLDAATFGGFGLFWMGLGTLILWGGAGEVLRPMAIAYTIFAIALTPAYFTVSYVLGILLVMLVLVFVCIAAGAPATVLGSVQLITFIVATVAIIGAVWYSTGNTTLMNASSWLLNHPNF